jgi:hypothetical protein
MQWGVSLSYLGTKKRIADGEQDWLDPDAPPALAWRAKADPDFVANAF